MPTFMAVGLILSTTVFSKTDPLHQKPGIKSFRLSAHQI